MHQFVKQYDYFVQIYNENTTMDVEDFRTQDHDFLNKTILKLQSQTDDIEKLDMRSSIRIVRLDGEKMKKRIKDSPK